MYKQISQKNERVSSVSLHGAVSYYKVLYQSPILKEWSLNGHSGHYLFQLTLPIHIHHNVGTERQLAPVL